MSSFSSVPKQFWARMRAASWKDLRRNLNRSVNRLLEPDRRFVCFTFIFFRDHDFSNASRPARRRQAGPETGSWYFYVVLSDRVSVRSITAKVTDIAAIPLAKMPRNVVTISEYRTSFRHFSPLHVINAAII